MNPSRLLVCVDFLAGWRRRQPQVATDQIAGVARSVVRVVEAIEEGIHLLEGGRRANDSGDRFVAGAGSNPLIDVRLNLGREFHLAEGINKCPFVVRDLGGEGAIQREVGRHRVRE